MCSGMSSAECEVLYAKARAGDSTAWSTLTTHAIGVLVLILEAKVEAVISSSDQKRLAEHALEVARRRLDHTSKWEDIFRDAKGVFARLLVRVLARVLAPRFADGCCRFPAFDGEQPSDDVGTILGESASMVKVREQVAIAARSNLNVLITGETGTGKELVAREIHRLSPERCNKPLVTQNCGAIPSDLFESQFFGHLKGAFTSADRNHPGRLVRADGSDLFLDELEALILPHQVKLLRVLENGEVEPLGSQDLLQVNVRWIAATNQNARRMVAEGHLREDLYHRLRQLEIVLPPLRDHMEDIPLLARHFLRDAASALTPDAIKTLQAYDWPGNVRELKNVVLAAKEVAFAARERRILPGHLAICEPRILAAAATLRDKGEDANATRRLREILDDCERRAVTEALRTSGGSRHKAASILGIDRKALRMKIERLGIEPTPS